MDILLVIVLVVVVLSAIGFLMRKNPKTLTDKALWYGYSKLLAKRIRLMNTNISAYMKEPDRTSDLKRELEERGYDINLLSTEEGTARLERRAMDFSRCLKGSVKASDGLAVLAGVKGHISYSDLLLFRTNKLVDSIVLSNYPELEGESVIVVDFWTEEAEFSSGDKFSATTGSFSTAKILKGCLVSLSPIPDIPLSVITHIARSINRARKLGCAAVVFIDREDRIPCDQFDFNLETYGGSQSWAGRIKPVVCL